MFKKRMFDLVFSLAALILLAPLILLIAILIYTILGSPILFRQIRPGKHNIPFTIIKFRSMHNSHDKDLATNDDSLRLTRFGSILRSTSLDELPNLWTVLKGDMSIVGPRPLLMEYLPLYNAEQAKRHLVKPGLTGWAQINGRNAIGWDEKFQLDVWYVENQSFWLDIKIIFLTIKKIILREGINQKGETTMSKFTGNI